MQCKAVNKDEREDSTAGADARGESDDPEDSNAQERPGAEEQEESEPTRE